MLEQYGFENVCHVSTPMDPNVHLSKSDLPQTPQEFAVMKDKPYREAIGSLNYMSLGTHPDIAYVVSVLSHYLDNPKLVHWAAVKWVFAYLAGMVNLALTFGGMELDLEGYTDVDGSMDEDWKAMSGYAFLMDGGAVLWNTKKQEIIALSTTEAEYVATTHAAKEGLWLRTFMNQVFGEVTGPLTLHSDNQSVITLTRDHQYHTHTKHIDIRFHFIQWIVEDGKMKLIYCPTEEMVTDCWKLRKEKPILAKYNLILDTTVAQQLSG